jgi:hypothetical protein
MRWGVWARFGTLYFGLSLGVALTAVGNAVELGSVLFGVRYGYPSPVDILDVVGGLVIVLGLFPFLYSLRANLSRNRILFFFVGALFVMGSVSFYMFQSDSWSASFGFADLVSLVFPGLGVIGVILSFLLYLALVGSGSSKPWFALALGALFFSAGSIAYGIATMRGWYYVGNQLEILWDWGYIALTLGFELEKKALDKYET